MQGLAIGLSHKFVVLAFCHVARDNASLAFQPNFKIKGRNESRKVPKIRSWIYFANYCDLDLNDLNRDPSTPIFPIFPINFMYES